MLVQLQPAALFACAGFYSEVKAQCHPAYCLNEGDLKVGASDVFLKENRDTSDQDKCSISLNTSLHALLCGLIREGLQKHSWWTSPWWVLFLSEETREGVGGAGWGGLFKKQDKYWIFFWYTAEEAAELQKEMRFGALRRCVGRWDHAVTDYDYLEFTAHRRRTF